MVYWRVAENLALLLTNLWNDDNCQHKDRDFATIFIKLKKDSVKTNLFDSQLSSEFKKYKSSVCS